MGRYCHACGQDQRGLNRRFAGVVAEIAAETLGAESRVWRTLATLIARPGRLTMDYCAGRRARYVPPFRLYLFSTLVLVFVLALGHALAPNRPGPLQVSTATGAKPAVDDQADDLQGAIRQADLQSLPAMLREPVRELALRQTQRLERMMQEDPDGLFDTYVDALPPLLFLLLPLAALLLQIAYAGSGRYFGEHLVFVLHAQAFLCLALVAIQVVDWMQGSVLTGPVGWLGAGFGLWAFIYPYLALYRCYGESAGRTLLKFVLLGIAYCFMLVFVMTLVAAWEFFTL